MDTNNGAKTMTNAAELTATMHRAFDLVCPAKHAQALAAAGKLPQRIADGISWKDQIGALVTDEQIAAAGVTIEQIADAVEFFTATKATVTRERIGGTVTERFDEPRDGYLVIAPGYRRGPAA